MFVDCENRILYVDKEKVMGEVNHGHFSLSWVYNVNGKKQSVVFKPNKLNYRKGNYLKINENLKGIDWDFLFRDKDINGIYSTSHVTILYIIL